MQMLLTNRFRALGTALGLTNCRTRREEHLLQCLEFYEALIHRDSGVLLRFLDSMDERI